MWMKQKQKKYVFWIFELKICEFVNSELFLTKLSGIDLHENVAWFLLNL